MIKDKDLETDVAGWLWGLPVLLIGIFLVNKVAPHLVSNPDLHSLPQIFVKSAIPQVSPDPLKQIRFLIEIGFVPALYFILLKLQQKFGLRNDTILRKLNLAACIILQAVLLVDVIVQWKFQEGVSPYFHNLASSLVITVALGFGLFWLQKAHRIKLLLADATQKKQLATLASWASNAVAVFITFCLLLTSVYTEANLRLGNSVVAAHFDHWWEQFSAVLVGKTPLVDFFPLYSNILPYLFSILFGVVKPTVFNFTAMVATCSFVGLMSYFYVFKTLRNSALQGLILYLAFLGAALFTPVVSPVHNAFNYYAVWPFRYFFPSVVISLLVVAIRNPSFLRVFILGAVGGFGVLNNMDFGLPALVGAFAGILLSTEKAFSQSIFKTARVLVPLIVGVLFAFLCFTMGTYVRSGSWPQFHQVFLFQRVFALYGFNSVSSHFGGVPSIMYFTFMGALCLAVYLSISSAQAGSSSISKDEKTRVALLSFAGIFGCGSMTYYIHRAYPEVLVSVFASWAFAQLILLEWMWHRVKPLLQTKVRLSQLAIWVVPFFISLFHFSVWFTHFPNNWFSPRVEIARIRRASEPSLRLDREYVKNFVKENTSPGETVTIMTWDNNLIAKELGLKNAFIYDSHFSIILKAQLDLVMQDVQKKKVSKVFLESLYNGSNFEELRTHLMKIGFQKQKSIPSRFTNALELWTRKI